jgi:hypothetical protein
MDNKQKSFLEAIGFDLESGWFEEDYQMCRREYKEEHFQWFGYY